MHSIVRPALLAAAVWAVSLSSCSLDYGDALAEELGEVPDTVVYGFSHTVVEQGLPRFRLEADKGESYQQSKKMKLQGVRFEEYEPGGSAVATSGRADSAVFYTDTESAELSGSVSFRSAADGVTVRSGYLKWDGEARALSSRADTVTTLEDDEGSSLSGSGFGADAASRSFSFSLGIEGRYASSSPSAAVPETAE